ncbi:MAG: DegT/DnrJ/EryC1/StrS family aminotransferase, partial [Clostridia bacterium]|nr:DegT/DnrJ/EryC1/StrS family aminotransferase [Clostridia bacterium]
YLKAKITELLNESGDISKVILPEATENSDPSWFGFIMTLTNGADRSKVVSYMESHGVQTRMLFAGNIIRHPCFNEMRKSGEGFRVVGDLEVTDRIMRDSFWIGVYPGMTDEMLDYMAETLADALRA